MFQSNIHYYVRIKRYIVSTKDVPRRTKKKMENLSQITRFLCMHKILVHAQHSCACTTLLCMHWRGQGPRPGPKRSDGQGRTPSAFSGSRPWSLVPPLHAQDCCACTGVLCMHKNLVHAKESCARTTYTFILT